MGKHPVGHVGLNRVVLVKAVRSLVTGEVLEDCIADLKLTHIATLTQSLTWRVQSCIG